MAKSKGGKTTTAAPATIADQLRSAILGSGETVYALAKASGTTQAMIARFVSGERDIRLGTAARIAAALGLALVADPPPAD